jgi:hypothetical protein
MKRLRVDNLDVSYNYSQHQCDGYSWDDIELVSIRNVETLEILSVKTLRESKNHTVERRIFDAIYADRQSKEGERLPVPDTDRVLAGDSRIVSGGDQEESKDNGDTDAQGEPIGDRRDSADQ